IGQAGRTLIEAVARAVLGGRRGDLRAHLDIPHALQNSRPPVFNAAPSVSTVPPANDATVDLSLPNGAGGFADEGPAYEIHLARGVGHELSVFVHVDDPVKLSLLTVTNEGSAIRKLSVFAYNDWVLGPPRESQSGHVVTAYDVERGAILASNAYNDEFAQRI